eukprot:COSAG02_NODE_3282_length_7020_cov_13.269614_5_plen_684_part_00
MQAKAQTEDEIDLDKHFSHLTQLTPRSVRLSVYLESPLITGKTSSLLASHLIWSLSGRPERLLEENAATEEQEAERQERLLNVRRLNSAKVIQRNFREYWADPARRAAWAANRERVVRELAEQRKRELELRALREAAAVHIQAHARGKSARDFMARNARLTCDLKKKIPLGSSEPKSAGAEAKQAMRLRSRAREVPLPAQLAAIHRGFRYLDAGSSFNKGRSDIEALWLLSEGADDICQIAADRPATRERLENLSTTPQHHRREFRPKAPDPNVFGPSRSPRPPSSSPRRVDGARTPKLDQALKVIMVEDEEGAAGPPAATVDTNDLLNSVSNMSGVYGITPRKTAKRNGSSLSARSTVTRPAIACDASVDAKVEPDPDLEPEPEQVVQPIPVHWGRTQTAALPKLAPPERFNLARALDVELLAAKRADMSGRQHQMRRQLKLDSEATLSEVKRCKERQHDRLSAGLWSQENGRDRLRSEKDQMEKQLSSTRATLETLLGADAARKEREEFVQEMHETEATRRNLMELQKDGSVAALPQTHGQGDTQMEGCDTMHDRSALVKTLTYKAGATSPRKKKSKRDDRMAKDRFARSALAHELVADINAEKHYAARRAHVMNMHQQRLQNLTDSAKSRHVVDPVRGLNSTTVAAFTAEHLGLLAARNYAVTTPTRLSLPGKWRPGLYI